jgi:hypothetical protein
MGQSIGNLFERPPYDRAVAYRELAEDMERFADEAHSPGIRNSYLELAAQWRQLADQIGGGNLFRTVQPAASFPKTLQP